MLSPLLRKITWSSKRLHIQPHGAEVNQAFSENEVLGSTRADASLHLPLLAPFGTTCRSWFSPSATCVGPGVKQGARLGSTSLYLLSHLPTHLFLNAGDGLQAHIRQALYLQIPAKL